MKTPWASIAKIEVGGKHSGTGFLVSGKCVLTALHVVAEKKTGRPFPGLRLEFNTNAEFADGSKLFRTNAHIVKDCWSLDHDFALLQCDDVSPLSKPLNLSDRCHQLDDCLSPGFAIQDPSGFNAIGTISSLNDPTESGGTAIGIQFKFGSGVLMKGHSGAPVFVNNRVVGLLRTAFLDESEKTMGGIVHAASMQQVVELCDRSSPGLLTYRAPIVWPAPAPIHARILADRKDEFEIFERMITGQSKERVLLLKGKSGSGKTILMRELIEYARGLGLPVAHVDCKGGLPMDSIITSILLALPEQLLPNTWATEGLRRITSMIEDLTVLERPLLLSLDTWQHTSDDVRKWIENYLLPSFSRMPGVLAIIGGWEIPNHESPNWGTLAVFRQLQPISSTEDWFEYSRRKWPSANIAKQHIEAITISVGKGGMPNVIDGFLDTLQGGLLASATQGGSQ